MRCAACGGTAERLTSPPWRCDSCDGVCAPVGDGRTLEVGSVELRDDDTDDTGADGVDEPVLAVGA